MKAASTPPSSLPPEWAVYTEIYHWNKCPTLCEFAPIIEKFRRNQIEHASFLENAEILACFYRPLLPSNSSLSCKDPSLLKPAGSSIPTLHAQRTYQGKFDPEAAQRYYENWYVEQVYFISHWLKTARPSTQEIMDTVSLARCVFSYTIGAEPTDEIGRKRVPRFKDELLCTSLSAERYRAYNRKILELNFRVASGKIESIAEPIELSNYIGINVGEIIHTNVGTIDKYWPKIEPYITKTANRILDHKKETPQATLQDLAFIHWWLAHLCLFARGSASITEIYILALCHAAGFKNASWVKGNLPDLEALCCLQLEEFQKHYASTCLNLE